nr:hypothetical protein Iba_chr10aCG13970 [Ipomoea batatas]
MGQAEAGLGGPQASTGRGWRRRGLGGAGGRASGARPQRGQRAKCVAAPRHGTPSRPASRTTGAGGVRCGGVPCEAGLAWPDILYLVYGGPDPLKPSLAPSVGTDTKSACSLHNPPRPGAPAPGGNGGGDEVLVSVRAEGHPTLPEGRGRAAQGSQPSAAEPLNGRRQDIIVPRPSQTDVRGRHVSGDVSLEGEGESVYRPEEGSKRSRAEGSSKSGGSMTSQPRRGREEGKPNPGNKPHEGSRMPPWAPAPPSGRAPHLVPFTPLRAPPSDILAYAEECHLIGTGWPKGTRGEVVQHPKCRKPGKKGIEMNLIDQ